MERINGFIVYAMGGAIFGFIKSLDNQPIPYARMVPDLTGVIRQLEVFVNPVSTVVEFPLAQQLRRH